MRWGGQGGALERGFALRGGFFGSFRSGEPGVGGSREDFLGLFFWGGSGEAQVEPPLLSTSPAHHTEPHHTHSELSRETAWMWILAWTTAKRRARLSSGSLRLTPRCVSEQREHRPDRERAMCLCLRPRSPPQICSEVLPFMFVSGDKVATNEVTAPPRPSHPPIHPDLTLIPTPHSPLSPDDSPCRGHHPCGQLRRLDRPQPVPKGTSATRAFERGVWGTNWGASVAGAAVGVRLPELDHARQQRQGGRHVVGGVVETWWLGGGWKGAGGVRVERGGCSMHSPPPTCTLLRRGVLGVRVRLRVRVSARVRIRVRVRVRAGAI